MAFYNPQRVVFNPDANVIQNAGAVGGVMYNVLNNNLKEKIANKQRQDALDAQQAFRQLDMLNKQRDFEYKQEQDNFNNQIRLKDLALKQRQNDFNNALNLQKLEHLRASNALKEQNLNLNLQKQNKELEKQNFYNAVMQNLPSITQDLDENIKQRARLRSMSQFLDEAQKDGKTYTSTHGFLNGAIERGFGGWGKKSTDLNTQSDMILQQIFTDLLKGGKNAKWSLENLKSNFPINSYTLEAKNQEVNQKLIGEWIATFPINAKNVLAEKLSDAKNDFERKTALDEYKENMHYYETNKPKLISFYFDRPYGNIKFEQNLYEQNSQTMPGERLNLNAIKKTYYDPNTNKIYKVED